MRQKIPEKVPLIEYKKILYTTDLSESGRYAFHHAASISSHYGAELVAFHVIEGGPELDRRLFGYVDEKLWEEIKTRNLHEARDILVKRKRDYTEIDECIGGFCDQVQETLPDHPHITYSIEVRMGDPVDEIKKEAESGGYDLIIIGSHGHGPIRKAMMGDTVRRVVRQSTVPVLVVRVPEDD